MAGTRIYAVAGAKGGVGKTTTSINLATSVATRGGDTIVVELDLAMANLVDFLSLETGLDDAPTVHEVLAAEAKVADAIRTAPGGIDVVPSGVTLDGFTGASVDRLPALLEPLLDDYDRIVLDTGAGLSRETVVPLALADEGILVSTPRVAAVRDVEKTKRLAERVDTPVSGVVFTKSGTGSAPPPPELADFLDVELLGHVPEDAAVPASQDVGEPVVTHASDSDAAAAYRRIATALDKRAVRADPTSDRSLTLPDLDAIGDRAAAEGPATASITSETTEPDTAPPATASTAEKGDTGETRAAATDDGRDESDDAESFDLDLTSADAADGWQFGGHESTNGGADRQMATPDADAADERASSDGGTLDGLVAETDLDAPAETDGETEMDSENEREGETDSAGENRTDTESGESTDESGSLRDRAKSLFGL
jgi:septum site-determining protein MinD